MPGRPGHHTLLSPSASITACKIEVTGQSFRWVVSVEYAKGTKLESQRPFRNSQQSQSEAWAFEFQAGYIFPGGLSTGSKR